MLSIRFSIALAILSSLFSVAFAQNCPKIVKDGNTLRVAEPLGGTYQWFKNGTPIPNATGETITPSENADYSVEVYGTSTNYTYDIITNPVIVKVSGQTLDRLLQPVTGVSVTFANQTVVSNAQGQFSFPPTTVNKGRIKLKYTQTGYFAAGQGLFAHQNGSMKTVVCLVDYGKPVSFKTADGLTVNTPNAKVIIPKNALLLNGQPYNDSVRFYMASFSPDDAMYGETMPGGDLLARNAANEEVILQSLGILNVEMRTPAGEALTLNPDTLATINFRVPKLYKTLAASKTQIPLWHYDETAQLWREEGIAIKQTNGRFEGQVSHFSWWNCDLQNGIAYVKGCVTNNCTGQPASYTTVYFNERSLVTDSLGCFFNWIPANQSYHVYADADTITITAPQAGDTLTISNLTISGVNVSGFGVRSYQTGSQEVRVYVYNPNSLMPANLEYSIDSLNFQDSAHFVGVIGNVTKVWVKQGICIKPLPVISQQNVNICPLVSDSILNTMPYYNTMASVVQASQGGLPVYKIVLSNKPMDANAYIQNPEICPCLQYLSLPFNQLVSLPTEIGNLTNLQTLNLNNNSLTSVPPEIGNLTNLQTLFLYENSLASVPPEIGNITNLKFLNLYANLLTSVPLEIGNLINLQSFFLSYNQLSAVPAEVGNLTNLQTLYIDHNQLTSIPLEIGNLINLQTLYLNENFLPSAPIEVGNLANLQTLDFNNNILTSIPIEIGNLTNLQKLRLSFNQLTSIPSEIGNLNNLQVLELYDNQLTTLPVEICNLKDTIGLPPYNCTNGNCFNVDSNPSAAAMQAQWDACP